MIDIQKGMEDVVRAAGEFAKSLINFYNIIAKELLPAIKIYNAPNSKIKHLALHSKKKRVRKKNIKRLMEMGDNK